MNVLPRAFFGALLMAAGLGAGGALAVMAGYFLDLGLTIATGPLGPGAATNPATMGDWAAFTILTMNAAWVAAKGWLVGMSVLRRGPAALRGGRP